MTLASLVAAGAPLQEIAGSLSGLDVAFDLAAERVEVSGVGALRATVTHPEQHVHRTFADVRALVQGAGLPDRVCSRAVEAFRRLAVAEGAVHARGPEEGTFFEGGGGESIRGGGGGCVGVEVPGVGGVSLGAPPAG